MPDRHKTRGLSWHPPGELSAWAREEAARRGERLSALLTAALGAYREACGGPEVESTYVQSTPQVESTPRKPAPKRETAPRCAHKFVVKGWCKDCREYAGKG